MTKKNYTNPLKLKREQIMQSRGINRSQFEHAYAESASGIWRQVIKLSRFKKPEKE